MKGITIGPAGGHGLSRMQGTKVTLAGRTAFLPNDDVPFVFQRLTAGQINAIPKLTTVRSGAFVEKLLNINKIKDVVRYIHNLFSYICRVDYQRKYESVCIGLGNELKSRCFRLTH